MQTVSIGGVDVPQTHCDERCGRRLLIEDRIPLRQMVSLDVLRAKLKPDQLEKRFNQLLTETERQSLRLSGDAFSACAGVLSARGALPLYVADQSSTYGFQIRPEVVESGGCCWSPFEAVRTGRFITKPANMLHNSREVQLDGQPIYVKLIDAKKAFQLRPTSANRLKAIIAEIINQADGQGDRFNNVEIAALVQANPDVWDTSNRRIIELAGPLKPKQWRKPGRHRRSRPKP